MKKYLNVIAFAAVAATALGLSGCAGGGEKAQADDAARDASAGDVVQGRQAVLVVYGMSCPLCANNVDKELLEIPGVSAVAVDMSTGRATVTLDGKTPVTRRQLARAVETSGFTLRSIDTH